MLCAMKPDDSAKDGCYLFFGDQVDAFVDLAEAAAADLLRHLPPLLADVAGLEEVFGRRLARHRANLFRNFSATLTRSKFPFSNVFKFCHFIVQIEDSGVW